MINLLIGMLLSSASLYAHIYPDSERRSPTEQEKEHTLALGNSCSASALTPTLMISADHCRSYTEGYFAADPSYTYKVVSIVESSSYYENDIAIYKIRWKNNLTPPQLQYVKKIVTSKDELKLGEDHEATQLFTIGFPMDLKQITYSSGFLKQEKIFPPSMAQKTKAAGFIQMNLPVINGNSGGSIYTEDYKLVGIVSAGGGFVDDADVASGTYNSQNPKYWNLGAALYYYYPKSPLLKKLFPKKP